MKSLIIFILIAMNSSAIFGQHYPFYLHGQIVEEQGANAVDTVNGFGAYQYEDILSAFRKANFTVLSEVRQKNIEPSGQV